MNKVQKFYYKKIRPVLLNWSLAIAAVCGAIGVCCLYSEGWWAFIMTGFSVGYLIIGAVANDEL